MATTTTVKKTTTAAKPVTTVKKVVTTTTQPKTTSSAANLNVMEINTQPQTQNVEKPKRRRFHLRHFLMSSGWTVLCGSVGVLFGALSIYGELSNNNELMTFSTNGLMVAIVMLLFPSPLFAILDKVATSFKESIY